MLKKSTYVIIALIVLTLIPFTLLSITRTGLEVKNGALSEAKVNVGTDVKVVGLSEVTMGSLEPLITETGKITLSVDAIGVYPESSGVVQVEKPSGAATVRVAYMAAATIGFTNQVLSDGDVTVDGVGVNWALSTPSGISSYNYLADVTSIVKPKLDAAPPGRVNFTVEELIDIDGSILAVIFNDPGQAATNTVVLLFGAQDVNGDTFAIGLSEPLDLSNPNLVLDFSLGISYSYQLGDIQYSEVTVNGERMTTWAGGEDDGASFNGALITAGGLDDSNTNPADPFATALGDPRYDDELYNLVPFVNTGDTGITIYTQNPSNDDNIFFSALFLGSTTAVVGEGIVLGPSTAENPVGTNHTVTARVQDDLGAPVVGTAVNFTVASGPQLGLKGSSVTDSEGEASLTYLGVLDGVDVIVASFKNSEGMIQNSNWVEKTWIPEEVTYYNLMVTVSVGGSTSPAAGVHSYMNGTDVNVTATPDSGWMLSHWMLDGSISGSANPVTVTMDGNHGLEAVFTETSPEANTYNLTITVIGSGSTSPAAGIHSYMNGTDVNITATPEPGYKFSYWMLDANEDGSANPITVTMDSNHSLGAVFTKIPPQVTRYDLTITVSGSGSTSPAAGVHSYEEGTGVSVTATPESGWVFINWMLDGSDAGGDNPVTVTMNGDQSLEAIFSPEFVIPEVPFGTVIAVMTMLAALILSKKK
jgi:hypothetical protein